MAMNIFTHIRWTLPQEIPHATYKALVVTGEFQVTDQLRLDEDTMARLVRAFREDMTRIMAEVHICFETPEP